MTDTPTRTWNGMTIPAAGRYELDQQHKRIGFQAMHMMVSPVRGEFGTGSATIHVAEDPLQSQVTATIDAASIATLNDDRDAHLRSPDFLDVDAFPTLEFRSTGIEWQRRVDPISGWAALKKHVPGRSSAYDASALARAGSSFVLHGNLTIRGITHPIALDAEFGGTGLDPYGRDIFGFSASAELERETYGLLWNVALEAGGVLVAKKVRIELAGEAIRYQG